MNIYLTPTALNKLSSLILLTSLQVRHYYIIFSNNEINNQKAQLLLFAITRLIHKHFVVYMEHLDSNLSTCNLELIHLNSYGLPKTNLVSLLETSTFSPSCV